MLFLRRKIYKNSPSVFTRTGNFSYATEGNQPFYSGEQPRHAFMKFYYFINLQPAKFLGAALFAPVYAGEKKIPLGARNI